MHKLVNWGKSWFDNVTGLGSSELCTGM